MNKINEIKINNITLNKNYNYYLLTFISHLLYLNNITVLTVQFES